MKYMVWGASDRRPHILLPDFDSVASTLVEGQALQQAWRALYETHTVSLTSYFNRTLGDGEEHASAFLEGWARRRSTSGKPLYPTVGTRAEADFKKSILNYCADEYRRRGRRPEQVPIQALKEEDTERLIQRPPPPTGFIETFDRTVRGLPEPERDVWILVGLRGLKQTETAALLGLSVRTVWERYETARKTLAAALNPDATLGSPLTHEGGHC